MGKSTAITVLVQEMRSLEIPLQAIQYFCDLLGKHCHLERLLQKPGHTLVHDALCFAVDRPLSYARESISQHLDVAHTSSMSDSCGMARQGNRARVPRVGSETDCWLLFAVKSTQHHEVPGKAWVTLAETLYPRINWKTQ